MNQPTCSSIHTKLSGTPMPVFTGWGRVGALFTSKIENYQLRENVAVVRRLEQPRSFRGSLKGIRAQVVAAGQRNNDTGIQE